MNNYDISVFINWFVNMFYTIWDSFFDILKSISFNGTNLYWIIIIIMVLRISVPILVQLHEEGKTNESKIERSKYNAGRNNRRN